MLCNLAISVFLLNKNTICFLNSENNLYKPNVQYLFIMCDEGGKINTQMEEETFGAVRLRKEWIWLNSAKDHFS